MPPADHEVTRRMEYIALPALQPASRNPKRHRLDVLEASVSRFGYIEPVVIDDRTGRLVAGHGRVEALRRRQEAGGSPPDGVRSDEAGVWLVPALRGWSSTDDAEAEAYVVASNHITEAGGWDQSELVDLLADLAGADGEGLIGTGFSSEDLVAFLDELAGEGVPEALTDPDDVPEAPPAKTVLGDVWLCGPHRVMCGDATVPTDVERLMDGARAEMVFTDPPYGVGYDGGTLVREKLAGDESTALYGPACLAAAAASTPDAPLYLWHAGVKGIAAAAAAAAAGYEIRCELIWNKNQAQFGALGAQYKQKHEPCYYCFKRGQAPNWCGPTNEVTVWDVDRAAVNDYHPTQKPVALAVRALTNHTAGSVLDLFGGSGSTLIAAHQTGRVAYLMELDPRYVDVILARWAAHTGQKPVLESTGEVHGW